jgi:hypothetical protein
MNIQDQYHPSAPGSMSKVQLGEQFGSSVAPQNPTYNQADESASDPGCGIP